MRVRPPSADRLGLSAAQFRILKRLRTPERIQDFVTALPTNFESGGDTALSVRQTLAQGHAHCLEGAFVAACALWIAGEPPLLMDLQADATDDDHVVAVFRRDAMEVRAGQLLQYAAPSARSAIKY